MSLNRSLFFLMFCMAITNSPLGRLSATETGLDQRAFDKGIRVQDDLYQAVNGTWLRDTEIPSDKSDYGSFTILDDLASEQIRAIIEDAAKGTQPKGSDAQKVGDFYKSFMDEARVEALGAKPLEPHIAELRKISDKQAWFKVLAEARVYGLPGPVGFFVDQDDKDSTRYLAAIVQSGTSLPDRDYYLNDKDEKFAAARAALKEYIGKLWSLRGLDAGSIPADILALETRFAEVQWERTMLRDAEKRYNKKSVEELAKLAPGLPWAEFFAAAGAPGLKELNVATPSFFEGLAKIIEETPLETLKQYLEFRLVDTAAPYLSKDFDTAHFQFHGNAIAGIPQQKARWERGVEIVSGAGAGDFGALGDVLGKLYVEKHFTPAAKARMDQLVKNLLAAYERSIGELTWMTDGTKARAREKLAKINTKIGYTNKWRDYSGLSVDPQDLLGNIIRSNQVEYKRMIDKLGKPVDREEWGMTPQTINAYYNPSLNEIVFPAAILQPPFFNSEADDATNYGGIGAVIGHEISHAFDDQGSKYDGDGNLKNWWSPADRAAFTELTKRLIDQYNEYAPLPGKTVNGQLTLGENIADLSGLSIAYKAYQISLGGKDAPVIDGWTGNQRFFLGWSQVWRRKYRDAEMMRRLLVDPHSPSWYRANGPVINIDAFYDAFGVKESDRLYRAPSERIRIW